MDASGANMGEGQRRMTVRDAGLSSCLRRLASAIGFLCLTCCLSGCILTRTVWEEKNPGGAKAGTVTFEPVTIAREGQQLYASIQATRDQTIMAWVRDTSRDHEFNLRRRTQEGTYRRVEFVRNQVLTYASATPLTPDAVAWDRLAKLPLALRLSGIQMIVLEPRTDGYRHRTRIHPRAPFTWEPSPGPHASVFPTRAQRAWLERAILELEKTSMDGCQLSVRAIRHRDLPAGTGMPAVLLRLWRAYERGEQPVLAEYQVILGYRDGMDVIRGGGEWEVGLDDVVLTGLIADLHEGCVCVRTEEAIPATAIPQRLAWNDERAVTADAMVPAQRYKHSLGARIALTPPAVVGDAVIIVTAPLWFPIAVVLSLAALHRTAGGP